MAPGDPEPPQHEDDQGADLLQPHRGVRRSPGFEQAHGVHAAGLEDGQQMEDPDTEQDVHRGEEGEAEEVDVDLDLDGGEQVADDEVRRVGLADGDHPDRRKVVDDVPADHGQRQ